MTELATAASDSLARNVRVHVFTQAAETGRVPQAAAIATALQVSEVDVRSTLKRLASEKVLILAPNDGDIWAANPFCAVPSGFRVEARGRTYWGICIWDALGIVAALGSPDTAIHAPCGDCGELMSLTIKDGKLEKATGIVHFAVPAHSWWDNIGFT